MRSPSLSSSMSSSRVSPTSSPSSVSSRRSVTHSSADWGRRPCFTSSRLSRSGMERTLTMQSTAVASTDQAPSASSTPGEAARASRSSRVSPRVDSTQPSIRWVRS